MLWGGEGVREGGSRSQNWTHPQRADYMALQFACAVLIIFVWHCPSPCVGTRESYYCGGFIYRHETLDKKDGIFRLLASDHPNRTIVVGSYTDTKLWIKRIPSQLFNLNSGKLNVKFHYFAILQSECREIERETPRFCNYLLVSNLARSKKLNDNLETLEVTGGLRFQYIYDVIVQYS